MLLIRFRWAQHSPLPEYHGIVLHGLLPLPWILLCCIGLMGISWVWYKAGNTPRARLYSTLSHIFADIGIVLAAYWLVYV